MGAYITLGAGMLLLPGIYWVVMELYRPSFQREENQKRISLTTMPEYLVVFAGEAALVRVWWNLGKCNAADMRFQMLFIMLTGMMVFCVTDYREQVVPNRLLLLLLLSYFIILGFQGIRDMGKVLDAFPSMILGLLFCMISFGLGYLLSRGSMGAGDVKLSFIMGLYLTGEYVVGAVFYGCVTGAVFAVVQLFRRKLSRKDTIPFVPFLYLGLLIRYFI